MWASLAIWLIFCPFAGAMAFAITFEEYRHHFPDRRRAVRESLLTAWVTFAIFVILGCVMAALMPRLIR